MSNVSGSAREGLAVHYRTARVAGHEQNGGRVGFESTAYGLTKPG